MKLYPTLAGATVFALWATSAHPVPYFVTDIVPSFETHLWINQLPRWVALVLGSVNAAYTTVWLTLERETYEDRTSIPGAKLSRHPRVGTGSNVRR